MMEEGLYESMLNRNFARLLMMFFFCWICSGHVRWMRGTRERATLVGYVVLSGVATYVMRVLPMLEASRTSSRFADRIECAILH
jgi:hypothetical protein